MHLFLCWLTKFLAAPRVIYDREGGTAYLSRWYLIGEKPAVDPVLAGQSAAAKPDRFQLYLHYFHRSDDDGALHSHPFAWSIALILFGGYSEERRVGNDVVCRVLKPFRFNFLRSSDYHRVDLLNPEGAWSLFLVGPKVTTWYFWDRNTKLRAPWRAFLRTKRGLSTAQETIWEADVQ